MGTFKCRNGKNRRGENEYLVKTGIKIAKQRYETEGRKERREKGKEGGRWAVNARCSQKGCLFKEERKEKKKNKIWRTG